MARKKSKPKGNSYENKIASDIRKYFVPEEFDDKTGHNLVHRTPMSGGHVEKGDIIMKPPILKVFPWFIECRNRESWSWKNIIEKGRESVIGRWFQEDAIDKCHAYDYDAEYVRYPLLIFTQNFGRDYFCARYDDLKFLLSAFIHTPWDVIDIFNPSVWISSTYDGENNWVIGDFENLLGCFQVSKEELVQNIQQYLGESHESNGG